MFTKHKVLFDLQWFWASIHMDACADETFYHFTAKVSTNRQTGRQTDRQTDRLTGWQTDRQTDRQTSRQRQTDRQTDWQTDRLTDRQTDRQTGRQTDRQTGRQDRQTEGWINRQTDREPWWNLFVMIMKILMYCFALNQNQIVGLALMAKFILSLWIITVSSSYICNRRETDLLSGWHAIIPRTTKRVHFIF